MPRPSTVDRELAVGQRRRRDRTPRRATRARASRASRCTRGARPRACAARSSSRSQTAASSTPAVRPIRPTWSAAIQPAPITADAHRRSVRYADAPRRQGRDRHRRELRHRPRDRVALRRRGCARDRGRPRARARARAARAPASSWASAGRHIEADVSRAHDVERLVAAARERGRLDIFVANAAIAGAHSKALLETTEEDWDAIMAVNLRGVFLCARAAIAAMVEQEAVGEARGRLILISSQHGMVGPPGHFAYAVSKGGIVNMARQLAVDYGPRRRARQRGRAGKDHHGGPGQPRPGRDRVLARAHPVRAAGSPGRRRRRGALPRERGRRLRLRRQPARRRRLDGVLRQAERAPAPRRGGRRRRARPRSRCAGTPRRARRPARSRRARSRIEAVGRQLDDAEAGSARARRAGRSSSESATTRDAARARGDRSPQQRLEPRVLLGGVVVGEPVADPGRARHRQAALAQLGVQLLDEDPVDPRTSVESSSGRCSARRPRSARSGVKSTPIVGLESIPISTTSSPGRRVLLDHRGDQLREPAAVAAEAAACRTARARPRSAARPRTPSSGHGIWRIT